MTAPLTPPDCDLRGLTFMPLDVLRLRDSDLALLADGDEFKAAVLLWCASWHQTPAGSLSPDDRALCKFSGLDAKTWKRAKAGAMRGWVLCDDGRLYHPVVAEKALEAWKERQAFRKKRDADRERLKGWREKKQERNGDGNASETQDETRFETEGETSKTEEGRDRGGKGQDSSVPDGTAAMAAPPDELSDLRALPVEKGAWRLAVKVLVERGRLTEAKARTLIGKLTSEGISRSDLWSISEDAWSNGTLDPAPYLIAAAERLARPSSPTLLPIPPDQILRVWCEDWLERPHQWRQHERGPPPGKPGCRIKPEILEEFGLGNVVAIGIAAR